MSPAAIRRRLDRLEQVLKPTRISFWDVLCGAISAESLAPEDIKDWDKWGPLIEEAIRLAELPDPIEAKINAVLALPPLTAAPANPPVSE